MNKTLIKLDKVWKTYIMGSEKVNALKGISFDVKNNEFIVIVGPSGSGKSTMMNLVGCLDIPTQGTVFLDGKDISELNESSLAKVRGKKIGFVFQKFNLIPTLTAVDNVALPSLFQGGKLNEKAKKLLTFVGLQNRLTHKPNELSGGEQQRVAIARSLINDPDIILADEPTGNLDTKTGNTVMDIFKELHKQGKTIIFVTHNPILEQYAQRILRIKDGQVKEENKSRKIRGGKK
ncbi:lipoprotein-releasing system ATP-binding protein LolD [Candidatus Woesearchaeota archaeon CG10_big_fil_rev_8_21_14_0_10_30_7]|nr:MAG: lipoprotein-releasing system ATP-binding protein LolD [Candidatus Woesearchaeota archaeon CG10_big_fil_rev_8_21_14_0_10_30_7]